MFLNLNFSLVFNLFVNRLTSAKDFQILRIFYEFNSIKKKKFHCLEAKILTSKVMEQNKNRFSTVIEKN